ncbi:hypothetical protein [Hafnia alvei]|uniref:hypothetical protein n=1 Tax=Hafnia alvei TaxID=569 RepID=UPI0014128DAD|nr:hypothetical protein [Hafnia alvei]QIP55421.1 hypothetical protein HBA19_07270 [Hafnia alvei]
MSKQLPQPFQYLVHAYDANGDIINVMDVNSMDMKNRIVEAWAADGFHIEIIELFTRQLVVLLLEEKEKQNRQFYKEKYDAKLCG